MKIIRWLLSHTFLILLIIVVIYGYMFWGNLAGEDTPAGKAIAYLSQEFVEVEEFVEAVKSKQAELAGEQPATAAATEKGAETAPQPGPAVQVAARDNWPEQRNNTYASSARGFDQRSIEQQPASISYSHNQMQVKQNSGGIGESAAKRETVPPVSAMTESARPAVPVAATNSGVMNTGAEKYVPAEVEKQLSNVDPQGKVIDSAQNIDSVKASWITARKSFYQRNYEKSIQSYQEVIDNTEDNFDAYGELGNVYFNQGKKEQAASAYYEAAAILVRKGQVLRARSLIGLLRHLDRSKADQLQALIDSAVS